MRDSPSNLSEEPEQRDVIEEGRPRGGYERASTGARLRLGAEPSPGRSCRGGCHESSGKSLVRARWQDWVALMLIVIVPERELLAIRPLFAVRVPREEGNQWVETFIIDAFTRPMEVLKGRVSENRQGTSACTYLHADSVGKNRVVV